LNPDTRQQLPATIHQLHALLKKKAVSSEELVEHYFQQIQAVEAGIHAYRTILHTEAKAAAREADRRFSSGEAVSPLTGIPIALKDNLCTAGVRTTCASKILEHFSPPYDATVVQRLKTAGSLFLGKTNMDEFAMGSSTENSAFTKSCNPWNRSRVPGGSSGGSAAAVAAGMAVAALGSDTGGSIRQPAACCGIVGLKPTYGRVSRYGLIAFASSLDQIGPMTRDVTDAALMMNVMSGHDPNDSTSVTRSVPDFTRALSGKISGVRIGIPKEYFIEGIEPDVTSAIDQAIVQFKKQGAIFSSISLPHTDYAVATYYILATAEASSNLARYDGVRFGLRSSVSHNLAELYMNSRSEGFGPEVKRRIMLGTYALSSGYYDAYYKKAQQVRTLIKQDFDEAFQQIDLILTPTMPTVAFGIGEKTKDPLQMYLSDIFTISVNLAGIPAISIPCGFSSGLPIGLQILGRPFDEEGILAAAYAFEQATDYHLKRPI